MDEKTLRKKIHDAKSHLTIMLGYLQMLKNSSANVDEEKKLEWIEKAISANKKLEELLNEIK
jgi:imidazoleglycerol phosphate synthase glutamine amidotransferase subunit HisH